MKKANEVIDEFLQLYRKVGKRVVKALGEAGYTIVLRKRFAECKRLEDLVRESRLRCAWHKREQWCGNVDCYCIRAGHVLEAALSDTAQQETPPKAPPHYWQGVEERKGASDMRERAAKIADLYSMEVGNDIRDLPIDPETVEDELARQNRLTREGWD